MSSALGRLCGATASLLGDAPGLAGQPSGAARLRAVALDAAIMAVPLALYAMLKAATTFHTVTDENVYFYDAWLIAQGKIPYRDFFFAHPPLHILIPGLAFAVCGFDFVLAKAIPALAAAVSGVAVYYVARDRLGRAAGLTAMVAFLFASETLKASANLTGVNLTTMFMSLGLLFALRGRPMTSGLLFGAAASTGFYSIAVFCAVAAMAPFRSLRFAGRMVAGFLLLWGSLSLIFLGLAGKEYIAGVYTYHGRKIAQDSDQWEFFGEGSHGFFSALWHNLGVFLSGKEFRQTLYYHSHLFLAPLLWLAYSAAARLRSLGSLVSFLDPRTLWTDKDDRGQRVLFLSALALFMQFSMFKELYDFYFVLFFPMLAALVAAALIRPARDALEAVSRRAWVRAALAAAFLAAYFVWVPVSHWANNVFPDERKTGERVEYSWVAPEVLPSLGPVTKALFFRDHRFRGDVEPGWRHFLWSKQLHFSRAREVAEHVREHTRAGETITGASGVAPLIALLSGRPLAADIADTNAKRFKTGMLTERDFVEQVCATPLRYVVSAPMSYFERNRLLRSPTWSSQFAIDAAFPDPALAHGSPRVITLFRRVAERGSPPYCEWKGR